MCVCATMHLLCFISGVATTIFVVIECPLPLFYRSDVLHTWLETCQEKGVPCSERFKLEAVLGDPVKVCVLLVCVVVQSPVAKASSLKLFFGSLSKDVLRLEVC
jgi:hypothetical protein